MATYTKDVFTGGGADGLGILVAATATAGTLLHTASSTATDMHEIWIYANNTHSAAVTLTIEFGGVAAKDLIQTSLPLSPSGLIRIVSGLIIKGNATPKIIRAFASTINVVSVFVYTNKIA